MTHFKTLEKATFEDYVSGFIKAEVAKDARPMQAGDVVILQEVNAAEYTGRESEVTVKSIDKPKGLLKGFSLIQYGSVGAASETTIKAAPVAVAEPAAQEDIKL